MIIDNADAGAFGQRERSLPALRRRSPHHDGSAADRAFPGAKPITILDIAVLFRAARRQ